MGRSKFSGGIEGSPRPHQSGGHVCMPLGPGRREASDGQTAKRWFCFCMIKAQRTEDNATNLFVLEMEVIILGICCGVGHLCP